MGKLKTIIGFVGVIAALVLWRTYAPGAWVTVWGAMASLMSAIGRL